MAGIRQFNRPNAASAIDERAAMQTLPYRREWNPARLAATPGKAGRKRAGVRACDIATAHRVTRAL